MPATKKAPARADNTDNMLLDPGIETWKNISPSTVHIIKLGDYGKRESEIVYGGRAFSVTPQERRLNQSQIYDTDNDPFTNGTFAPLALVDTEPDTETLRSNPNVLDDAAIIRLFAHNGEAFSQQLLAITNLNAVDRLIETAKRPETGASVQQLDILKRYRKLLSGEKDEPEAAAAPGSEGLPRAVTPR